ncbi:MAG: molybdenum cofactor biosynthesis protein MoaB [Gemmatimonadota bacterium]|jgi:molybdenum cofactor biosynthesis protein B|nr:molybdenum cofactor biosynthesis protein MoaB [Gemmatimonadota bacterium]
MSTPSSDEHRKLAAKRGPVSIAVVTVSDSRTPETDTNGAFLRRRIEGAGHRITGHRVIRDDPEAVTAALDELAGEAQIVIFNGGTGISRRDNTFDALSGRLEKVLPGFGEIFRMLSYAEVGSAAILSRAVAGTYRGAAVISLPGSPAAVRLAWERLIEPELPHLAWELGR